MTVKVKHVVLGSIVFTAIVLICLSCVMFVAHARISKWLEGVCNLGDPQRLDRRDIGSFSSSATITTTALIANDTKVFFCTLALLGQCSLQGFAVLMVDIQYPPPPDWFNLKTKEDVTKWLASVSAAQEILCFIDPAHVKACVNGTEGVTRVSGPHCTAVPANVDITIPIVVTALSILVLCFATAYCSKRWLARWEYSRLGGPPDA